MTCRHGPHDPACSSYTSSLAGAEAFVEERREAEGLPSVDTATSVSQYTVEDFHEIDPPSPIARFPGSPAGWELALMFAKLVEERR